MSDTYIGIGDNKAAGFIRLQTEASSSCKIDKLQISR